MKITSSEMQLLSSHVAAQKTEVRESMRVWVGAQRPDFEGRGDARAPADQVTLSDAGRAAAQADAMEGSTDETESDPRMLLMRALVRMLTGEDVRVFDVAELHAPAAAQVPAEAAPVASVAQGEHVAVAQRPAGYGVEYDYHASHSEFEQTSFAASGVIKTADGQEIRFDLELQMSRSYHEESDVRVLLGDATRQKKDPLVINFAGNAAQLSDQLFKFDLDANGTAESISRLASGSGFLTLDRNHDGQINNGSELFGTRSGDGFADLAALDGDGNGWIDENDAAYAQLGVWTPDAGGGGKVLSLKEADVGALSLARVATPFDLRNGSNETLGQIRSSGVFLQENGGVGSLQQVDLSV
ncbi:MAG: VCBS repeat-containing protein [Candidatus Accumulibacter phosphatis]|uniref:VCBS repeat-containing protein n=2 Tax=Candidatus Accumulibacter TaxID=327159 RepID=A0A080M9I6_9PROT|nr:MULTISPECIES: hypothetical protein [Candidatus Accumulibacter]KFB77967.1 MAG: hypothetical protein AW06_000759 [Candidatus Accumulibacter cognatus]MBL8399686.1 VCBS repeat-containing protein [Accumulibacter sp.]MCC2867738.1 VCBS repeat-containing protein [Candidatus Accumulibacter phosphatis]MCM8580921.1 VCBS repeat-containing protein [Accumulibacter sp.]MCM8620721.1 VCBS repeat-containing protein [Accumulibacter sp.]